MSTSTYIVVALVAIVFGIAIIKRMLRMGFRILLGILMLVFVFLAGPRINTFIVNKLDDINIIEKKLSQIINEDMEKKVKREYKMETGYEVEDEALLEQLKAETFKYDPTLSDDLNIMLNAGLPQSVNNTLLLNFSNMGESKISAETFSDYVAKFVIIRVTTLLSYLIAFTAACKIFNFEEMC